MGCVLMRKGQVVAYDFRQLKPYKRDYPIHNLELAIIVFALKIWYCSLYGQTFKIHTNHERLKCLFS